MGAYEPLCGKVNWDLPLFNSSSLILEKTVCTGGGETLPLSEHKEIRCGGRETGRRFFYSTVFVNQCTMSLTAPGSAGYTIAHGVIIVLTFSYGRQQAPLS